MPRKKTVEKTKAKKPKKMTQGDFLEFCQKWYAEHTGEKLPKNLQGYDDWLNYFKTRTPVEIERLVEIGRNFLTVEAFAALSRWHDIVENPHKIDKIYQAGLENKKDGQQNIIELAQKNDRLGVLYALRDEIAQKLAKGASTRDLASLTREMGDILDQIAEIERKNGVKKDTKLAELMGEEKASFKKPAKTPKRTKGKGARTSSITGRMTIEDMEA